MPATFRTCCSNALKLFHIGYEDFQIRGSPHSRAVHVAFGGVIEASLGLRPLPLMLKPERATCACCRIA